MSHCPGAARPRSHDFPPGQITRPPPPRAGQTSAANGQGSMAPDTRSGVAWPSPHPLDSNTCPILLTCPEFESLCQGDGRRVTGPTAPPSPTKLGCVAHPSRPSTHDRSCEYGTRSSAGFAGPGRECGGGPDGRARARPASLPDTRRGPRAAVQRSPRGRSSRRRPRLPGTDRTVTGRCRAGERGSEVLHQPIECGKHRLPNTVSGRESEGPASPW